MNKEIKLYGEVSEWSSVSQRRLDAEMKDATGTVKIRVHSPGGSVFEGWAMYNFLQSCAERGLRLEFYVDGIAASMMSFIVQAGHAIYMAENSMMMIHPPSGGAYGNAAKVRSAADLLDKVGGIMSKLFVAKSNATEKKVSEWMSKDTWFTPQEALDAGLIDGITEAVTTRKADKSLAPQQAYEAFAMMADGEDNSQSQSFQMKAVIAHLGLADSAPEVEVLNKIRQLEATVATGANALAQAEKDLADLRAKSATDRATSLIDGAVAANKVAPGDKEKYQKLAVADYDTTKELIEGLTPIVSVTSQIKPGEGAELDLAAQWDQAHKEGTLERIKVSNPTLFASMKKARWGSPE